MHEMSNPFFLGKNKKNLISLSSAELAHSTVSVKLFLLESIYIGLITELIYYRR